ncbi:MAG TPA: SDR family oxidoreductase, partial [Gemmatimonadales bacterium]|nr:SDR family oxidoreductase [Gemmatimonadales bacterium]
MPPPFFGYGHRPAWEDEPAEGSAVLEQEQPQPIAEGFPGKVVIVTGGATGLGRAIALEFARLGCHIAFCYVNMPGRDVTEQALLTETALASMGVGVLAARCDVRDRQAVERFVRETQARLGGVHILVNNAGI